ncbi:MAG: isoprenylcysteine carboxyl methyltransferase family protein [Carbonactinosporaceae bacterium]
MAAGLTSETAFTVLVALVAAERLAELAVARRHLRWLRSAGGVEYGRAHYPLMVVLHAGLLVGALAEVWLGGTPFVPVVGWPALALTVGAQALRWWCIAALGPRWTTRVVVVPGLALVTKGPYRWLRHPNYLAVVVEGAALPLVHTAWVTALLFTVANAVLLSVRIHTENTALAASSAPAR